MTRYAACERVDAAVHAMELKWGKGAIPHIARTTTQAAWARGWSLWTAAIEADDVAAMESLSGPLLQALAFIDAEAAAIGNRKIGPRADGTVQCDRCKAVPGLDLPALECRCAAQTEARAA